MINSESFSKLLLWLDEGADSDGQNYLKIRQRLVDYFDRKNCQFPDDLADETLNRIARRLAQSDFITSENPARYCYITARFVFLEYLRSSDRKSVALDEAQTQFAVSEIQNEENNERRKKEEQNLARLENCVGKLSVENREIISNYYLGNEREKINNRLSMAERLGISPNALRIRACRIREKLEDCVKGNR